MPQVRLCARSAVALAPAAVPSLALLAPALLPAAVAPARAGRRCRARTPCRATVQFANDSSRPAVPRPWREGPRSGVALGFRVRRATGSTALHGTAPVRRRGARTDWPARAAAAQASGVAAAKRLLRLRALPAPLATALRPLCYVVLRDARGQEHRPPLVRRTWLSAPSSSGIRRATSIRTLCSRGFPARLKFALGAKVRALPCRIRSSDRA